MCVAGYVFVDDDVVDWKIKCCYRWLSDRVLQEDEDLSVSAKDQVIDYCRRWCSSIEDVLVTIPVTDDCWKIPMTYRCITLTMLQMLSLRDPIVDDVVVSRIPFSLRGSVGIL